MLHALTTLTPMLWVRSSSNASMRNSGTVV